MANDVTAARDASAAPAFWRDESLPFIEGRSVRDGRKVCYARHSHETFSIGVITGGRSTYLNGKTRERVGAGAVVVMNPEEVHACNPIDDQPWSYRMLYVDVPWLTTLQRDLGFRHDLDFRPFSTLLTTEPRLYDGFNRLYGILTDTRAENLQKHSAAITFFSLVQQALNPAPTAPRDDNPKLQRAADFISDNCTRALKLEDICAAADLSPSYLTRSFKKRYGMTPHAYLVNRRIQYARTRLKRGHLIADVALDAGFADQAHFQRAFKRALAATPGQYRG